MSHGDSPRCAPWGQSPDWLNMENRIVILTLAVNLFLGRIMIHKKDIIINRVIVILRSVVFGWYLYIFTGIFYTNESFYPLKDLFRCDINKRLQIIAVSFICLAAGTLLSTSLSSLEKKVSERKPRINRWMPVSVILLALLPFALLLRDYNETFFYHISNEPGADNLFLFVIAVAIQMVYFIHLVSIGAEIKEKEYAHTISALLAGKENIEKKIEEQEKQKKRITERMAEISDMIADNPQVPPEVKKYFDEVRTEEWVSNEHS